MDVSNCFIQFVTLDCNACYSIRQDEHPLAIVGKRERIRAVEADTIERHSGGATIPAAAQQPDLTVQGRQPAKRQEASFRVRLYDWPARPDDVTTDRQQHKLFPPIASVRNHDVRFRSDQSVFELVFFERLSGAPGGQISDVRSLAVQHIPTCIAVAYSVRTFTSAQAEIDSSRRRESRQLVGTKLDPFLRRVINNAEPASVHCTDQELQRPVRIQPLLFPFYHYPASQSSSRIDTRILFFAGRSAGCQTTDLVHGRGPVGLRLSQLPGGRSTGAGSVRSPPAPGQPQLPRTRMRKDLQQDVASEGSPPLAHRWKAVRLQLAVLRQEVHQVRRTTATPENSYRWETIHLFDVWQEVHAQWSPE